MSDFVIISVDPPLTSTVTLDPGTTVSGLVISGGELLQVTSGSRLSAATVLRGGAVEILSGGQDFGTTLNGGASYVDAGGVSFGTNIVGDWGFQTISSGGNAFGTVVSFGGDQFVSSGGTVEGTVISSGGGLGESLGANVSGVVFAGGNVVIDDFGGFGSYLSGYVVSSGFILEVEEDEVVSGTAILSGGIENLFNGAHDFGTIISNGGSLDVWSGSVATGVDIAAGTLEVRFSATASGVSFIGSGGTLSLEDPADFIGTLSGWQYGDILDFPGFVLSNVVQDGATLSFSARGENYSYALDGVPAGATVTSQSDGAGGTELGIDLIDVTPSHPIAGRTITDLLVEVLSGGFANALTVGATSEIVISSGGVANGLAVGELGRMIVLSGGIGSGTVIGSGGELDVESGGVASDTIVENGGLERGFGDVDGTLVNSGGTIVLPWASGDKVPTLAVRSGVTLETGAILGIDIQSGLAVSGLAIGGNVFDQVEGATVSTVLRTGGEERVSAGGTTSATRVQSGGTEVVGSGGVAESAIVTGGALIVSSGSAIGTVVSAGGVVTVDGGTTNGTTIAKRGSEIVEGTGVASGTTIGSGSSELVESGGVARSAIVTAGGKQQIIAGGRTFASLIEAGGSEVVSAGGWASGTTVSSGGKISISSGGIASGTAILAGGVAILSNGATAYGTKADGGEVIVSSGGYLDGAEIAEGGSLVILNGASAAATVSSGSTIFVSSGGSGGITIAGGLAVVKKGANSTAIGFTSAGGVLELDGSGSSNCIIFEVTSGDVIDLAGVAYSSSGVATLAGGNKLRITENGKLYTLQFYKYDQISGYHFELAPDAHGGTEVEVVPIDNWSGPSPGNRSGDWSTALDWENRHLPNGLVSAVLGGTDSYVVTSEENPKVASLTVSDPNATLDINAGFFVLAGPDGSVNSGTIAIAHGAWLVDHAAFDNDGVISVAGNLEIFAALNGLGTVTIKGGTVDLKSNVAASETIGFAPGTAGTLVLNSAELFAGTVAGLAEGDAIDLVNIAFAKASIVGVSGTGVAGTDTLVTIKSGGRTANIELLNQYANEFAVDKTAYQLAPDQYGYPGTLLELVPPHQA